MRLTSLRAKLFLGSVCLIVVQGSVLIFFIQTTLSVKLTSELQKRGLSIARAFAGEVVNPILTENRLSLQLMTVDRKNSEEDIEYVFITDAEGKVLAHTFGGSFPTDLKKINPVRTGQASSVQSLLIDRTTKVFDIAVPVLNRQFGTVHIGISQEHARKSVWEITRLVFALTAVISAVGIAAGLLFIRKITRPISEFVLAAREVGGGDLGRRIAVTTDDEVGRLAHTFNSMVSDLQKTTISRANLEKLVAERTENLKLFSKVIEEATDGIRIMDPSGHVIYSNKAIEKMYGYEAGETIGKHVSDFTSEKEILREALPYIRDIGHLSGELTAVKKGGQEFPVWFSDSLVRNSEGLPVAIVGIIRDVTERNTAEEQIKTSLMEKEVLLKEVHHRVKNNLQVISSLLSLQSDYTEDARSREMFLESRNRVRTMSLIHEKLYQSADLARIDMHEYACNLIENLVLAYRAEADILPSVKVEDISLGVDTAIPIGLIINELVSNSLKYAFRGRSRGQIRVEIRRIDTEIELIVGDDGIGIPEKTDFRNSGSLGLHLVATLAEKQLRGTIQSDGNAGTQFRIRFNGGRNGRD